METWRRYHDSPERPEYREAIDHFLRIIGDESVSNNMRVQVAQRLAYHCSREGTVTEPHIAELRRAATPEWRQRLHGAMPVDEPEADLVAGAFAGAEILRAHQRAVRFMSLEQDLAQQLDPLGSEISGWLAAAKQDELPQASAFDDEPLT